MPTTEIEREGPASHPPRAVRWAFEPARAVPSPCRDRLERASFRRGWALYWTHIAEADGYSTLRLSLRDDNLLQVRAVAFTRKSDSFDEAQVAEGVAEWIMDPLPEAVKQSFA